jgi:anti-anti-sigma factor
MRGTCRVVGEIAVATALPFQAELYDTIDDSDTAVVVLDCTDVTNLDAAGYDVLVRATDYAFRRGRTLVISNLSPPCAMLLRQCDAECELRIEA